MKIKLAQLDIVRILLSISLFLIIFGFGWTKGGRWDLNEQILTGYTIVRDHQSAYLAGTDGGFAPVTVYSYLQPLLLGLFTLVISPKSLEVVTVCLLAPSLGVIFYNLLLSLSLRLRPERYPRQLHSLYAIVLFTIFAISRDYLSYLSELKPDTLALVFLGLALYSTVNISPLNARHHLKSLSRFDAALPVSGFIYLAVSAKQQTFLPVLVCGLFLMLSAYSVWRGLLYISSSLLGIILPSLLMPGYSILTIYSHAGRGYESIPGVIRSSTHSVALVAVAICTVIVFAGPIIDITQSNRISFFGRKMLVPFRRLHPSELSIAVPGNIVIDQIFDFRSGESGSKSVYGLFLIATISWFFAQFASTFNLGGNQGNFQIGILPLVAITLPWVFQVNILSNSSAPSKYLSFAIIFASVILPLSILIYGYSIYKVPSFIARDNAFQKSIKSRSSSSLPILVDGDSSLIAFESGLTNQISLYHAIHLSFGKKANLSGQPFLRHLRDISADRRIFYFLKHPINHFQGDIRLRYLRQIKIVSQSCLQGQNFCYGYLDIES